MIIEKRITIKELYNILDEMVLKKTKIILCTNITTIPNKLLDKIYIPKISEDDNAYFDEIFNIIKRHSQAKSNEEKISDKILLEMKKMGFEMKNKGDLLLLEVIKYIKINGNLKFDLINEIYIVISNKFNISVDKIKWNIIYSINRLEKYNRSELEKYFNQKNISKPTPKYIIHEILEHI